jgi:very-short-patch-repair endonuclease
MAKLSSRSNLEETLAMQLKMAGLSARVVREYRFAPPRRWKFDFYFAHAQLAIEVEGGVWIQGRHSRALGMIGDMTKYNQAAEMGITVLRYAGAHIVSGEALAQIERMLAKP